MEEHVEDVYRIHAWNCRQRSGLFQTATLFTPITAIGQKRTVDRSPNGNCITMSLEKQGT